MTLIKLIQNFINEKKISRNLGFKTLLHQLKLSIYQFVFPSHCLYCKEFTSPDQPLLCSTCSMLLELIDPNTRCINCFQITHQDHKVCCQQCLKQKKYLFNGVAAALDYQGPAAAIVKKIKYGNQPYLAEGAAALMMTQLDRLEWPTPDVIIPVPLSFTHWIERGYNQSELLANELGKWLNKPVVNALKRTSGDYSQAGLNLSQRKKLMATHFKLKKTDDLKDKIILLVDDVNTTGSTLNRCAEVLIQTYPMSIYGLTFCRVPD